MFISTKSFASAVGVTDRAARDACKQGNWRGTPFVAIKCEDEWHIDVTTLDQSTIVKLEAVKPTNLNPFAKLSKSGLNRASIDLASDRFAIIQPILSVPEGQRLAVLEGVAAEHKISAPTLYRWISAYETDGLAGLCKQKRKDMGQRRTLVSRAWDTGIDLSDAQKAECADKLDRYGRSLVAKSTSLRETFRLGGLRLYELSRDYGSELKPDKLSSLCQLNIKWAKRFENKKRLAIYNLDNKQHFDRDLARVSRNRSANPMDLVWGDVHPIDVFIPGQDGSQLRVRLIAWMDDATHYLWATPHILRKGQGIRQPHIANSLFQMVCDPCGGLPETLYLDNGSEYTRVAAAMSELPRFHDNASGRGIVKAKPYNGPAKGLIEGAFGRFEQGVIKHLPGWIGGDRTNKKTHAVGKPVKGFQEGEPRLIELVNECVAIYNDKPQHGRLNGQSPREAMQEALTAGWASVGIPENSFDAVFSTIETRQVNQGKISVKGEYYYCDALLAFGAGTSVEVRLPLRHDARSVQIWKDGQPLDWAFPDTSFDPLDTQGAIEVNRRQKLQIKHIRALADDIDQDIDPHAEQLKYTNRTPLATQTGGRVYIDAAEGLETLTPAQRTAMAADRQTENDRKWSEIIRKRNAQKEKASGGNH